MLLADGDQKHISWFEVFSSDAKFRKKMLHYGCAALISYGSIRNNSVFVVLAIWFSLDWRTDHAMILPIAISS